VEGILKSSYTTVTGDNEGAETILSWKYLKYLWLRSCVEIAMQYKPFPPEKRAYILQKPFEEFEQFFQELSPTEQNRLASSLPSLPTGGFRANRPERRKMQLQRLWSVAKNPERWSILEGIWQAWVTSHPELNALLEHYDNSDDFQDEEPKPPNTYLDIECVKYLTYASFNNKISQEVVRKFYEFGYFKKENVIDSYVYLANSIDDIEKNKTILSALEMTEKIKNDITYLERKNREIIETQDTVKNKVENFGSLIFQQKNDFTKKIEGLSLNLLGVEDLGKRLMHIEDFVKTIEHACAVHQQSIESISEEYVTRFLEMQEYIDLLGTTADENSRNIAELRAFYHQLVARGIPAAEPVTITNSSLALDATNTISARVSPTTPPIEDCRTFLQNRLLPALVAWMPDMTLLWAELFHHTVRACQWVLIPNPAWGLAYCEAMGGTATIQVTQVEPTWLCFADAWKGAVEQCWKTAYQQPESLHLLLLEDVNRTLPECWAKPLLDLLAGFREVLPVAEQFGWPENLRILVCLASDQATLPLSKTVVQHWAAVSRQPLGAKLASAPIVREGHVPWDAWKAWGLQDTEREASAILALPDGDAGFNMQDFGPLARSVTKEMHRLEISLQRLEPQREVAQTVRNIRIKWPQEYLQLTDDADE
jgi:hypothetical protein